MSISAFRLFPIPFHEFKEDEEKIHLSVHLTCIKKQIESPLLAVTPVAQWNVGPTYSTTSEGGKYLKL